MNRAEGRDWLCWLCQLSQLCWFCACSGRSIELQTDEGAAEEPVQGTTLLGFDRCGQLATTRCSGSDYQSCNATPGGPGWVTIASCESPAACGPVGGCFAGGCMPDTTVCLGHIFRRCNANGTVFDDVDECLTPAHCGLTGCRSVACEAGERRCNGDVLEECSPDRLEWEEIEDCFIIGCNSSLTGCFRG
jgi:hypothetical protein